MTNNSGISPQGYNVLVLPQQVEAKTKGGLYIPDDTKDREQFAQTEGTLVAASPMAFTFKDWPEGRADDKPRIGDRVLFSRYQATKVRGTDGVEYWLMKDESIAGVMHG
jgi:co-chaperonin GroES (HSP10)